MLNGLVGEPLKIGKIGGSNSSIDIIKTIFQDGAILLNDVLKIITKNAFAVSIPMPLLGFSYKTPEQVELLKFSYSEYPYINKRFITNSMVQEPTRFSIIGYKPVSLEYPGNNIVVNFATNELVYHVLKMYCQKGGTFSIITQWGVFNNLVLERFSGINMPDARNVGGEAFLFEFKRVLFANSLVNILQDELQATVAGILA